MEDFLESEEFYNAMQRYRVMPMTRQPDVIEAFEAVKTLVREQVAQQAAVIEQMCHIIRRYRDDTPLGYQPHMLAHSADEALAIQPCPEVLNKVRADAVRKAAAYCAGNGTEEKLYRNFADRIEKGEA